MIRKRSPLMPKATALWLIENTSVTFSQIADFCMIHEMEVQALADENSEHIIPLDPIISGQLTADEIERCSNDHEAKLNLLETKSDEIVRAYKHKKARYIPLARRQDKPDAIYWLITNIPNITDTQIVKLIGTTKKTILEIRSKTYWNIDKLKLRDPVLLGLCTQTEIDLLKTQTNIAENTNNV